MPRRILDTVAYAIAAAAVLGLTRNARRRRRLDRLGADPVVMFEPAP